MTDLTSFPYRQDAWSIDKSYADTDAQGYRYAINFSGPFAEFRASDRFACVRKRRWIRHQQLATESETNMTRTFTNMYRFEVAEFYENQRKTISGVYSARGLIKATDPYATSDASGKNEVSSWTFNKQAQDDANCCWRSEWIADTTSADTDGWRYGTTFYSRLLPTQGAGDFTRRRRWIQLRQWEIGHTTSNIRSCTWAFSSLRRKAHVRSHSGQLHESVSAPAVCQSWVVRSPDIFTAWEESEKVAVVPAFACHEAGMAHIQRFSSCCTIIMIDANDRRARYQSMMNGDDHWTQFNSAPPPHVLFSQIMRDYECLCQFAIRVRLELATVDRASIEASTWMILEQFVERLRIYLHDQLPFLDSADGHPSQASLLDFIGETELATMKRWLLRINQVSRISTMMEGVNECNYFET